jgi:phosphatidylinositol dimannoside acyltransferase
VAVDADRRRVWLFTGLGALLERLPIDVGVSAAELVAGAASLKDTEARRAVERNLEHLVGLDASEPVDPRVLRRLVRRTYTSYGRYWAEGAILPAMEAESIDRRIDIVQGREHLDEAMASGRGCIVALPHVGSWEWGGAYVANLGYPMTAVAERLEPPELFEWFVAKREQMGLLIEGLDDDAGRKLLSVLKAGGLVGLLCDRDLDGTGVEVDLLGRRRTIPAGPATLALRTGATLLAGAIFSGPRRHHTVVLSPPLDARRTEARLRQDVARVSQLIADELSDLIRRAPEQWHVFNDFFADAGDAASTLAPAAIDSISTTP